MDLWDRWWNVRQSEQITRNQEKTGRLSHQVFSVEDRLEDNPGGACFFL